MGVHSQLISLNSGSCSTGCEFELTSCAKIEHAASGSVQDQTPLNLQQLQQNLIPASSYWNSHPIYDSIRCQPLCHIRCTYITTFRVSFVICVAIWFSPFWIRSIAGDGVHYWCTTRAQLQSGRFAYSSKQSGALSKPTHE